MPAPVLQFSDFALKPAQYSLVIADLPQRGSSTVGVLLLDEASDSLYLRFRRDWETIASTEDAEFLAELEGDLESLAREHGGAWLLDKLENEASNSIRVLDREAVQVRSFERTLGDLYRKHVNTNVRPFQTHLPRYSLAVAAGPFLTNPEDVTAEEWVETPPEMKIDDDMFIAEIHGHSMEPRIPDGSLCVFRRGVVGSRTGRLVLVRNSELADENRYTVKRYRREGNRVRLESLNPDYPSWYLDPDDDKYEVVAEFIRVLE
jgi:phage repressor protein C with HTH and peptisase S24 domain